MRTGVANLPLHSGKCPRWLFPRMKKLAGAISEVIVDEYGQKELLRRLSDPFWFQGFGCVLGFDWHSSGLTTTVCGAVKEALKKENLGIFVAGGKGKASRNTLFEIEKSELSTLKIERLQYASKISAKVDNSVLQDGFQLYHHFFVFDEKGNWGVVQQGMNNLYARRYHWLSDNVVEFIEEPHNAICCDNSGETLDLTAKQSRETRKISVDLVRDNPEHIFHFRQRSLLEFMGQKEKVLNMTNRHWIRDFDLTKRDKEVLRRAYELQPSDYEELISLRGMGPKKIRALALISDLVYGSKASWKDPVKYSFSHGGKDGTPFPVDKKTFDNSINTLKESLEAAKIGEEERLKAIRRLCCYVNS